MKAKRVFFLAILSAGIIFSCKKKEAEPAPEEPAPVTPAPPTGINTVAEIFSTNGAPTQTFTVNTATASTLTVNGVKIEIPSNVFVTTGNGTVTGNVTLSVRTILDKDEIILSGAGANSTASKLVSTRGCVKITASQNTQELRLLGGGGGFLVAVPDGTAAPAATQEFYAPKISAVDSTKIWALGTDVSTCATYFDSGSGKYMQKATLDSLKWLNIGSQFDTVCTKIAVTATLNASQFTKSNTAVYLSFNGSLTVGAMYEISPGVFRISNMPQGKGAHIIAVAVINGQYYFAKHSFTISSTTVGLNMETKTITEVRTAIESLP